VNVPFTVIVSLTIAASSATGRTASAQSERVPESAVVSGVPQGMFVARSLLSGKAVCLLFLSNGRITRAIPEGGLEAFDWNRHRAAHGPDSGTWQMRGGQLVVAWGDGGVHQGPITVNPEGIEFYGKRYSKPASASLAALAGRWESARGTAITGGAGINRVSELVIAADGRYQWVSTTGGVVQGRAVASDRSMSGTARVSGMTIVFTTDAGTSSSHTLLPAAGQPVNAFSVDSDMFTRSGPAPATVAAAAGAAFTPPASSTGTPAASYQGLAFTMPAGWTTGMQQGRFLVAPPNPTPERVVLVVISGAEDLRGTLDTWLTTKMAADAAGLKVLQSPAATAGRAGALSTLSVGRTVQDRTGGVILQIYHAISDGKQSGLAMVATASEPALRTHMPGVQTIFQSLRFGTAPAPSSPSPAPAAGASAPKTVAMSDLVGSWSHGDSAHSQYRSASGGNAGSTTTAFVDGYTFNADGTYRYTFTGMINSVYIKESDSGTWGFDGGNLVIRSRQGRAMKTYRIIQFLAAPDGSATLTLLNNYYPPTDSNINVWGEKFVRKAK
jgi:hypothetical protein